MWTTPAGVRVFEPTLREVEAFVPLFDEIVWMGYEWKTQAPASARVDRTGRIQCVPFPNGHGGSSWLSKLKILPGIPRLFFRILSRRRRANVVHTRGPSVPALMAIALSGFDRSRIYWHKFAGNWVQERPPLSYAIQRYLLQRITCHKVTVNGAWDEAHPNILCFENPCFAEAELQSAATIAGGKSYDGKLSLLFVGRMEYEKGPQRIIDALQLSVLSELSSHIGEICFVGDGKDFKAIAALAEKLRVPHRIVGSCDRAKLNEFYRQSHLFLLPTTASEGFPKVIAEACAFGCLPIVSDVSSITHYVKHCENGLILKQNTPDEIAGYLKDLILDRVRLRQLASKAVEIAGLYTYERYNSRVRDEILRLQVRS